MKRAIVLCGTSGSGKTHARTTDPELRDLPCVDIADAYRRDPGCDWLDAAFYVLKQVRRLLRRHDVVVVEGYFLPGTTTRKMLVDDLKVTGAQAEFRWFWAPIEVCEQRISDQWERGEISAAECRRRIELLRDCWSPQEEEL